jgi:signal transduction histidine kinase
VDIVTLTQNIIADLEPRAAVRHITLTLNAAASIPPIVADSIRMSQVVTNLLTNAIKYSPDGTAITVRISTDANNILLAVHDQGIGIAPEHIGQLFQRFQRVHDKQTKNIEGTGLGLYISRSIVEQHSGHISVESLPGQGSTFTVYLPVKVPATSIGAS